MTIGSAERDTAGACVLAAIDGTILIVAVENADAVDTDFAIAAVAIVADADSAFAVSTTRTVGAHFLAASGASITFQASEATTAAICGSAIAVRETVSSEAGQAIPAVCIDHATVAAGCMCRTDASAANLLTAAGAERVFRAVGDSETAVSPKDIEPALVAWPAYLAGIGFDNASTVWSTVRAATTARIVATVAGTLAEAIEMALTRRADFALITAVIIVPADAEGAIRASSLAEGVVIVAGTGIPMAVVARALAALLPPGSTVTGTCARSLVTEQARTAIFVADAVAGIYFRSGARSVTADGAVHRTAIEWIFFTAGHWCATDEGSKFLYDDLASAAWSTETARIGPGCSYLTETVGVAERT